jgi:hypothetical protein
MTSEGISETTATMIYKMWRDEHVLNVGVLHRVHIASLIIGKGPDLFN